MLAALLAGLIGQFIGQAAIFYFVAAMSFAVIISVLKIRDQDIDYKLARGGEDGSSEQPQISRVADLLKDRRVLIFSLCAVLFHFANAAMLPLVGEVLSARKGSSPSLYMSACIITAQLVIPLFCHFPE